MKLRSKHLRKNSARLLFGLAALIQLMVNIGAATASAFGHYQPKLPENLKR